jgi:hypothetical protein
VIVGLAAVHRAVADGKVGSAWLWVTYGTLVLVAPFAVVALAAWGFVDNWLRSHATRIQRGDVSGPGMSPGRLHSQRPEQSTF